MGRLFKAAYFAGMGAQVLVRAPHARRRRQAPRAEQRISSSERGILAGLFFAMGFLPVTYSFTSWLDFANYRLSPGTKTRVGGIGTMLLAAAVWLFWRAHRDLGTNWSPSLEIGAQHTLITQGVYRTVRHPMYSSQLLWGFAQAFLLHNWIAGPAGLVAFLSMYLVRVPQEERMMLEHFGDDYRAYSARTGRILPRLRA